MARNVRVVIAEPTIVHELIDGEVVAIHNETGAYYSMRDGAAVVWQAIATGHGLDGVVSHLASGAGADDAVVAAGVEAFVASLQADGLVVATDVSATAPSAPLPPAPVSYAPPRFESFTDMQDLLLLDPIHEVGEAGWPQLPTS